MFLKPPPLVPPRLRLSNPWASSPPSEGEGADNRRGGEGARRAASGRQIPEAPRSCSAAVSRIARCDCRRQQRKDEGDQDQCLEREAAESQTRSEAAGPREILPAGVVSVSV